MSKNIKELSFKQCLELHTAANWYGSNATHGKPDIPVIYCDYPDHDGLYEYIGQGHIMRSSADINELYALKDIREALPSKFKTHLEVMVCYALNERMPRDKLAECVKDEMSKYVKAVNDCTITKPDDLSIVVDNQTIGFSDFDSLYRGQYITAPEVVFEIGDLVMRMNKYTGIDAPCEVIDSFKIKATTKYRVQILNSHKEMSVTPNHIRPMTAEEKLNLVKPVPPCALDISLI